MIPGCVMDEGYEHQIPSRAAKQTYGIPDIPFTATIITIITAIIFHSKTISTHITYAAVKMEAMSSAE